MYGPESGSGDEDWPFKVGAWRVSALTHDAFTETFGLNLNWLRTIQAQMQKIVVSDRVINYGELLDKIEDIGGEEIVQVLSRFPRKRRGTGPRESSVKAAHHGSTRMLAKSLQAGDPVFERVSHAIYLAARSVILGGSTPASKKLAETALRSLGAVVLMEKVTEAAEAVAVAAAVSCRVHERWYKHNY